MVALALAMALSGLFFLSLILLPVLAHWKFGQWHVRTLFLSLILCLVPMTPCETMLYWSHIRALVAYDGGTSVGHGLVTTLFLEHDFVPSAGTLDVGHGPVRTLFLSPVLCLVPMMPYETMLH